MIRRFATCCAVGLAYENYKVTAAADGASGLAAARDNPPDMVILDWMMPGMDGLEVCKRLRAASNVPILMLTAKESVSDRVTGLETGADDYMTKPFAFPELLARVHALLRRAAPSSKPEILRYADLQLDTGTRLAKRGERTFELTAKEYDLLEYLIRNPRQVLTREQILDRVWGYDFGGREQRSGSLRALFAPEDGSEQRSAPDPHRTRRGLRAARRVGISLHLAWPCK